MHPALTGLEPQALWKHFSAISAIPRASGNEAAVRDYVLAQAAARKLETIVDAVGNVVVRKPGRAGAVPACLQGHLDMVCEKNEGTAHNFDTDPIELVRDGDWLRANGTTLGADNGVGAAAALAVMESTTINHGPLEFVFTVDEETGLTGASEFPPGLLQSQYFLNLDGEEEGTLCIGCAGGINTVAERTVALAPAPAGSAWRVRVSGLMGGHSGIDIHKGRGNALRILGRAAIALMDQCGASFASFDGGSKRNAIPREAAAIAVCEGDPAPLLAQLQADIQSELGSFDPGLRLTAEPAPRPAQVIAAADARIIAGLLLACPHGVLAMSPDIEGLVQTSTNLAVAATDGGTVRIESSQRSAIACSKAAAAQMVTTVLGMAGFSAKQSGGYPGWKPEPNSDIVRAAREAHKAILGTDPGLVAMHAGLECGVIGEKHPGMQMISFGPHIVDVHSPSEKLKLSSVEPFWRFLTGLLERL